MHGFTKVPHHPWLRFFSVFSRSLEQFNSWSRSQQLEPNRGRNWSDWILPLTKLLVFIPLPVLISFFLFNPKPFHIIVLITTYSPKHNTRASQESSRCRGTHLFLLAYACDWMHPEVLVYEVGASTHLIVVMLLSLAVWCWLFSAKKTPKTLGKKQRKSRKMQDV